MNEFKVLNGYEVKDEEARSMLSEIGTFSSDETLTGQTWIDGKPIYRKVINFGPAFDNSADLEKEVSHGITWETITRFDGFARARSTVGVSGYYNIRNVPLVRTNVAEVTPTDPEEDPSLYTGSVLSFIDSTKIKLTREFSGTNDTLGLVYFIVEYTKLDTE